MKFECILYEVKNKVLTITLNRPERLNAYTGQMQADLIEAFDKAGKDDDIRVIIVTGAGRGFCAGADIKELQENPSKITDVNDGCWKTARAIHVSNVPVISACHGFILGGGILLAGVLVLYWAYDKVIGIDNMKLG